ncbi:MAG TPA: SPFH domain-containing protein [Planctomycetota bacterium]|nr:SPFH domain-containing protein [Planctomycetota bacterium]
MQEKLHASANGYGALAVLLGLAGLCVFGFIAGAEMASAVLVLTTIGGGVGALLLLKGLFIVNPNEGRVLQLFGSYVGTVREQGLRWTNPFFSKATVSLRVRNFETTQLKVNDHSGSPIEIGAVVVWNIEDSAKAVFEVQDVNGFVRIQSEAALRTLASRFPYEPHAVGEISLRSHPDEIAEKLRGEIQDRVGKAGVHVNEARISHLAYAQEIAQAMLRRQQAIAIIAARQKIVEGAVSMVDMALKGLAAQGIVTLDEKQKAEMVGNLLVVLCADRDAHPMVNVGKSQS